VSDTAIAQLGPISAYSVRVIFNSVLDARPYAQPELTSEQWGELAPRQIRLDELSTIKSTLDLHELLASDSTYFGDLFARVVRYQGHLYLETGLHRAVRAALQGRTSIHARIFEVTD
jgi:Arc/MetJ family transcription regulator